MRHVLASVILGTAISSLPADAAKKTLELANYLDFERVSDPQISPDGTPRRAAT